MRIKDLFTVPTGQKVTEKHLRRVLISSVCSILLCMSCLVGTTWAWFTVSVESKENEIQMATISVDVTITQGENIIGQSNDGNYSLNKGQYTMHFKLNNNATEAKAPVYLVISVVGSDEPASHYCAVFAQGTNGAEKVLSLGIPSDSSQVSFSVSWVRPVSANLLADETAMIGELPPEPTEPPTEETTEAEESAEPEASEEEEGSTESEESAEPEDTTTTEPTTVTEPTTPTEPTTATDPTTPTEPTTSTPTESTPATEAEEVSE